MKPLNTVNPEEIARFTAIAEEWWDPRGKFKPLHAIAPLRIGYVRAQAQRHFGLAPGLAKPLAGLRLLDIGCGGGLMAEPMARLGATVTAIDAGEKNIRVAALHAEQSGLSIDYRCATAEALLAEETRYDAVLALEIIEHVANPAEFARACLGLLRPGGLLIFSTMNRTPKAYALAILGAEYILRWLPRGTHEYQKFVRPSELAAWLRTGGGEVLDMCGMAMHPLSFTWALKPDDLSVNYLLTASTR